MGKAPAVAVAVEGDPDTVFLYARKAPASAAADRAGDDGLMRVGFLALALILLGGGALAGWRWVRRKPKRSQQAHGDRHRRCGRTQTGGARTAA